LEIVGLEGLLASSTEIDIERWTERQVEIGQEYGPDGYVLPYCWSAMENNRSSLIDPWTVIHSWTVFAQWTAVVVDRL
jgi:hypothetical protein